MKQIKLIAQRDYPSLWNMLTDFGVTSSYYNTMVQNENYFYVNHHRRFKDFKIKANDEIVFELMRKPLSNNIPQIKHRFKILYEDDYIIAINKPRGLLTLPAPRQPESLGSYLAGYSVNSGQNFAIHPVGRLDKGTSGVVIFAKDPLTHALMQDQKMQKNYQAIIQDDFKFTNTNWIILPLGANHEQHKQVVDLDGKKSITKFKLTESRNGLLRVSIQILTGRMHQIRAHFAAIGLKILGDKQYGVASNEHEYQLLHCESLIFRHPYQNVDVIIRAELPKDFEPFVD